MSRKELERLEFLLQYDGPWAQRDAQRYPFTREAYTSALDDPAPGWRVVEHFLSREGWVPPCLQNIAIFCAHCYLKGRHRASYDSEVRDALLLHTRPETAAIANALLLCGAMEI